MADVVGHVNKEDKGASCRRPGVGLGDNDFEARDALLCAEQRFWFISGSFLSKGEYVFF